MAPRTGERPKLEDAFFLLMVTAITLAFAWVVEPFLGAILWSVIAVVLFAPMSKRLLARMPGRRNSAALITLLIIVALIIVPAMLLTAAMVQEANSVYAKLKSGEIDLARGFLQVQGVLPNWASEWLTRMGLTDFNAVRDMVTAWLSRSVQTFAGQAVVVGQSAFGLIISLGVMLYLTFFVIRDGHALSTRVASAIPLQTSYKQALAEQFVMVIRATVKGTIVVAIVQGLIGGATFWFLGIQGALLWGVVMGIFSLLPAIGTAIVWVPVALYLLVSGQIWEGVVLVACGVFLIGLVDNILRPILVGRDARMPDFLVLITTLGGIEAFGIHGFVIGPVIAALFLSAWNLMTERRTGHPTEKQPPTGRKLPRSATQTPAN